MELMKYFIPDMHVVFRKDYGCYVFTPKTDLGKEWCKRCRGIVIRKGFLVATPLFNKWYDSMLKTGLTVELEGD